MKTETIQLNQKDIETIRQLRKDFLRYIEEETLYLNSLKKESRENKTTIKGTNCDYYLVLDPRKLSYEQESVDGLWNLYEKLYQ